jgi:hypothetical protein
MPNRFRVFVAVAALVLPALAQQKAGSGTTPSTTAVPAPSPKPAGLTVDGVISMVEAGLSDDVIIARLQKEDKGFDLTTDEMIRIKKAKVSDVVLRVMMDPKAAVGTPAGASPMVAPPVVVTTANMPMIPGIRTPTASGATPGPGAEARGDPNDPTMPHDSGIYLMTKDRDGKPQMIVLERASYQGSKSGGYLSSAMTYGIVKAKTKAVIPGPRASLRVTQSSPVFYFYFDDKQAGLGKTYFGVGNLSNPNQFSLLKMETNKQNRESTVGSFSSLGSSSGADAKAMVTFKSERVRPGLYKVSVESLKNGEYCFVASSNSGGVQGPYAAMAMTNVASDIFDFGVTVEQ